MSKTKKVQIPASSYQNWIQQDIIKLEEGIPVGLCLQQKVILQNEIQCGMCQSVPWEIVRCYTCQQCYCRHCIKQRMQKISQKCIKCGQLFKEAEADHNLIEFLEQQQFSCYFKEDGCNQIIEYLNFESHLSLCQFRRRVCSLCNSMYFQKDQLTHKKTCWDVEVKCDDCNTVMTKKEKSTHNKMDCLTIQTRRQQELINKLIERLTQLEKYIKSRDEYLDEMDGDIESVKKSTQENGESISQNKQQITQLLQLQQSFSEVAKKQSEHQQQLETNNKNIEQLFVNTMKLENPFWFSDHSRIDKAIIGDNNLAIKLIEEKSDQKGIKHGAAFEIFTKKDQPMKFEKNKTYQIIFDVQQLKGSADIGLLVNGVDEISFSNKSRLKKRQITQESKVWKLIDQKDIPFKFGEGDRVQFLLTGWIVCLNNFTQRQAYTFDIRQEITNNLADAKFNFTGGLYDQNDCIIFYS